MTPNDRRLANAYADLVLLRQHALATSDTGSSYAARADSVLRVYEFTRESFRSAFIALPESEPRFTATMQYAERRIREGLSDASRR